MLAALLIVLVADPAGGVPAAGAGRARALPAWSWPVPEPHRVVRGFQAPVETWSPGHRGIDVEVGDGGAAVGAAGVAGASGDEDGAVITAPDDGVVHFAGTVVDRPVLSIEHADGVLSSFEPVVATVSAGEHVSRGQVVGRVEGDHCDPVACVHVGARIDGKYVSPLLLLGVLQRSVLLPTRPLP
ncbi:peptidoglycan DD-metalloendopeptidase family protein [Frondihabitans cladoniiphilus]|uniref:peptidoglycan DD-metalloendopeptidase family protein n=1 Tax=Frondihabitans cladoniiphilus TaxID=715785 RepID=UPI0031EA2F1B